MDTGALTIPYARVKAILDDAAGGSSANYGGAGRFWEHSLTAFKATKVHGVAMMDPA